MLRSPRLTTDTTIGAIRASFRGMNDFAALQDQLYRERAKVSALEAELATERKYIRTVDSFLDVIRAKLGVSSRMLQEIERAIDGLIAKTRR